MNATGNSVAAIIEKCTGDNLPYCQAACPLHIDMKGSACLIREGKLNEAVRLIREKTPFPGILGRVCTHPCESNCKRQEVDESIAIKALKRSAADYGSTDDEDLVIGEEKKERVAIVGGGPAGLMAAYDLRKMGYQITIFEALSVLGGMLPVGIPEYRLPRDILLSEISVVKKIGVEVRLKTRVGADVKLSDLRRDFDAIFIATGAHQSRRLGLEGEDSPEVIAATDFLRKVSLGETIKVGERVVVVGGGNAAIDAARTAVRLGSRGVTIVYRRTRNEMPAKDESEEAEHEGIKIGYLAAPTRLISLDGRICGIECCRMKLGDVDESGRPRPIPISGSVFGVEADMIISAIGNFPDLSFLGDGSEIKADRKGLISVDDMTLETNVRGIFAGGDVVTGPKTVIDAMAAGRKAATSIDRFLMGEDLTLGREGEGPQESHLIVNIEEVCRKPRRQMPALLLNQRHGNFHEVELGLSVGQAREEAERCLACECKLCIKGCEFLKLYVETPKGLAKKFIAGHFKEKPEIPYSCNVCELCKKLCPEELDVGAMFMEIRQQMVKEGTGPLPQHQLVRRDQEYVTSDAFTLAQPDPEVEVSECRRVFFPGCSLSGYSPELVIKVYDYLRQKLPGTGIILGCCGAPTHFIGDEPGFQKIQGKIGSEMEKLGASELILACPDCYHSFKHHGPQVNLRSISEIIVEQGLPEAAKGTPASPFPCMIPARRDGKRVGRRVSERWLKRWVIR